jgi:hypothetical protein
VRASLALYLAALLTLCPLLCGAAEFGQGAHRHGVSGGCSNDSSSPDRCPEEGDNCICQGAVPADNVRHTGSDAVGLAQLVDAILHAPLRPIAHLTCEGIPTGLAGWGDALAVRAFLQNFRC